MSLTVSNEQLHLCVTKLETKFPSSENCHGDICVIGGKCAHILTVVKSTLRLLTLSSGWQVNHGKGQRTSTCNETK